MPKSGIMALTALTVVFAASVATAAGTIAVKAGDPVAGKTQYESRCGGCHSVDTNRIGPLHRGVIGRKPGSVPGYSYSPALRKLGGVWTTARVDQWLQGPQKMAPGSNMYLTVGDAATRANIIAYLHSVSSAKAGRR